MRDCFATITSALYCSETLLDEVSSSRALINVGSSLQDGKFPKNIKHMSGVQWLKLDRTGIDTIPEEMGRLMKLEHLSMKNNQLEKLYGELTDLTCLRSLNMRRNNIKSSGIPNELFDLEELTTLDLSHNKLKEVPEGLEKAKSLLVLNLSNNQWVLTMSISNWEMLHN